MPEEYKMYCSEHNIRYRGAYRIHEEIIADADILYMTRVQRERFTRPDGVRTREEYVYPAQ